MAQEKSEHQDKRVINEGEEDLHIHGSAKRPSQRLTNVWWTSCKAVDVSRGACKEDRGGCAEEPQEIPTYGGER